jgi:RNA polymerase sigma-70 factor (ECF subfamily)
MGDVTDVDEALLRAMRRRELTGLDRLYDRYGGLAFSLALRMTGDRRAAEEVVQEAFLRAWREVPRTETRRGAVRDWLLSIVHQRAVAWLRGRAGRRAKTTTARLDRPLATAAPDPAGAAAERDAIQRGLAALPDEQRRALTLAYFGGFSQAEIAAATGAPLASVERSIRLGMQRLRAALPRQDVRAVGEI